MNNQKLFEDRLGKDVDVNSLIARAVQYYGINPKAHVSVVDVGYEDFNIKIQDGESRWLIKIFSIERTRQQVTRYVEIVEHALKAGVLHPRLISPQTKESVVFHDMLTSREAICMEFIEGGTFYQKGAPTNDQLEAIMTEVVKLHTLSYTPEYVFDSWAIPNIDWLYAKVKDRLGERDKQVQVIIENYHQIKLDQLSCCFVHGDIIKSNVIMSGNRPYIIDFSCANTYPKIQELAVMAANLLADGEQESFDTRVYNVIRAYESVGGFLTVYEKSSLISYAQAAVVMELLGSIHDEGSTAQEAQYWRHLAEESLKLMQ